MTYDISQLLDDDPYLRSHNTRRGYLHDIKQFEAYRNNRPFTRQLLDEYKAGLLKAGKSPAAVNRSLAAIRWWARHLPKPESDAVAPNEVISICAARDVSNQNRPPSGRHLTGREVMSILAVCANDHSSAGVRDFALIALAASTGLRRAELAGLTLANLKLFDDEIVLTFSGKGQKLRTVSIFSDTFDALLAWLKIRGDEPGPLFYAIHRGGNIQVGHGLTTEALAQMLKKRVTAADCQHLTWHDFRRTLAGDLIEDADIVIAQRVLGHASLASTARYDRRPSDLQRLALRNRHVAFPLTQS